jgi:hypothetical protein
VGMSRMISFATLPLYPPKQSPGGATRAMMDPCSQVRSIVRDGSWSTWQIAKRGERETKLCASVCVPRSGHYWPGEVWLRRWEV